MNVCRAPNETFSLVQSSQLSGKLSHLKNKHATKNVHASGLNANGSMTKRKTLTRLCSYVLI